jgi:hypothetical protein
MLPNFVIIGAQKSATTFLQVCLNDHPDVYLPPGETPFFESPDYERSGPADLEALFHRRPEPCLGIKRPSYIGRPEVAARILRHLPDARIVAVLRNPVERAVSAYHHNVRYGFLPALPIEIGMKRILSEPGFSLQHKRAPEIIECGYYFKYLSQYAAYKQRQRLLVLLHDEIRSDPLKSVQKAYAFLGVPKAHVPGKLHRRPQKVAYNLNRIRALRLGNPLAFRYNRDRTRIIRRNPNPLSRAAFHALVLLDKAVLSRVFPENGRKVGPQLETALYEVYAEDISGLEGFLQRSLRQWKPAGAAHRAPAAPVTTTGPA